MADSGVDGVSPAVLPVGTTETAAPLAEEPPRHYPLDIPTLPFGRYNHRLSVADVMVHRIMADFMNPKRVAAKTYDGYVRHPCDFNAISTQDKELGADYRCLQKLLATSYGRAPPSRHTPLTAMFPSAHAQCCGIREQRHVVQGPRNRPPLLSDQVLDLVTRHYLEDDDACLRQWLTMLELPAVLSDRSNVRKKNYQMVHVTPERSVLLFPILGTVRERRNHLAWTLTDALHYRQLSSKAAVRDRLLLYDGGAFLPHLHRQLSRQSVHGPRDDLGGCFLQSLYKGPVPCTPRPEEPCRMRFVIQPLWEHRILLAEAPHLYSCKLDLSLRWSRGRTGEGIWSTGERPTGRRGRAREEMRGRPRRRRCTSEPPPGIFSSAQLALPNKLSIIGLQITFPRMTLAQLDRRARRRSLSRTRIEEMFDWRLDVAETGDSLPNTRNLAPAPGSASASTQPPNPEHPSPSLPEACADVAALPQLRCENCAATTHYTSRCLEPCGHCGAPSPNSRRAVWHRCGEDSDDSDENTFYNSYGRSHRTPHIAPQCPVARQNRCKCMPFPTFHAASKCPVRCHRDCGDQADPPGNNRHRVAMLCKSRCCMCGLRGHSGRECRLRWCRCGEAHLGQDCRWNPACKAPGCPRFLCGLHCRGCGTDEKPFVRWRCRRCRGVENASEDTAAAAASEEPTKTRKRTGRRKKKGGHEVRGLESQEVDAATLHEATATALVITPAAPPQGNKEKVPPSIFGGPRDTRDGLLREK